MATTNPTKTSKTTDAAAAATPPLLALPPVLLTHILLFLEPHEIICMQELTTRRPALACLEEEGAVDGGVWKLAFELGYRRMRLAEEFFASSYTDKWGRERRMGDRFDGQAVGLRRGRDSGDTKSGCVDGIVR